ncbi:MAG TPA: 16S rRNA (guanine(527)-N(7))-methyltransferase RsmG [Bryobacteraceae bacterium]|nr:16S rRNA (guanine(527)-N(7))-methyltransferase RsmG [Bryobacteraceae bacterium]
MFADLLRRCAALTDEQAAALERHYELLCRWNRVLNLTRVEQEEEAVERHYGEALFLAGFIPEAAGLRIVDIGSGAGFPGFPVAVVRPQCEVTLIESHQRKAVFLREASRGLTNVRILAVRAEAVSETFDWVISRAVSYADLTRPVKAFGGRVALLTGAEEPPATWGLTWDVYPVPGGRQRFLRVSRETAQTKPISS